MSDNACDDSFARESLGLYALGALTDDEHEHVARHVETCPVCRAEVAELDDLMPMLELLAEDGAADDLIARYGLPDDDATPAAAVQAETASQTPGPQTPAARGPVIREPVTRGPATRRPGSRGPAVRRGRGRLIAGAAAAVLLVVAGAGGLVWVLLPRDDAIAPAGISASAVDETSGGSLSVTVADTAAGSTVRGTVSGLAAGPRYRLIAVTTGGDTHVAAEWAGAGAVQAVSGAVPVPSAEITFFAVITPDGTPVVRIPLDR